MLVSKLWFVSSKAMMSAGKIISLIFLLFIFSCRTESAAALGTAFLNLHLHNLHLHNLHLRDVSKLLDFAEGTMLLC